MLLSSPPAQPPRRLLATREYAADPTPAVANSSLHARSVRLGAIVPARSVKVMLHRASNTRHDPAEPGHVRDACHLGVGRTSAREHGNGGDRAVSARSTCGPSDTRSTGSDRVELAFRADEAAPRVRPALSDPGGGRRAEITGRSPPTVGDDDATGPSGQTVLPTAAHGRRRAAISGSTPARLRRPLHARRPAGARPLARPPRHPTARPRVGPDRRDARTPSSVQRATTSSSAAFVERDRERDAAGRLGRVLEEHVRARPAAAGRPRRASIS